ncbi:MAG: hypothetical protein BZ137_00270 [Methanosphaera sp. rholeuAM130]|nr:MAG: hypothetical protein BZ137_00270 [Methanosphaera sp. rholeuAM130]
MFNNVMIGILLNTLVVLIIFFIFHHFLRIYMEKSGNFYYDKPLQFASDNEKKQNKVKEGCVKCLNDNGYFLIYSLIPLFIIFMVYPIIKVVHNDIITLSLIISVIIYYLNIILLYIKYKFDDTSDKLGSDFNNIYSYYSLALYLNIFLTVALVFYIQILLRYYSIALLVIFILLLMNLSLLYVIDGIDQRYNLRLLRQDNINNLFIMEFIFLIAISVLTWLIIK